MQKYLKLFYDWAEVTETLSDAEKGRLIDAIVLYASTKREPQLTGAEKHLFPMFRAQINRDQADYTSSVENGKKGGRPNKNLKNFRLCEETQQNQEEDKEEDKDKDKDYINNSLTTIVSVEESPDGHSAEETPVKSDDKAREKVNYQHVVDTFNECCPTLPRVKMLTDKRRCAIKQLPKHHGGVTAEEYFKGVNASDFLSGRNAKWRECSFDWLMKPSNIVKVLEGNYDNKDSTQTDNPFLRRLLMEGARNEQE